MKSVCYRRSYVFLLLMLVFLFRAHDLFPQEDKQALQRKKQKLEQEIDYASKILEETTLSRRSSLNELAVLENKIEKTSELISTISFEISNLQNQIDKTTKQIKQLEEELAILKDDYARMVYYAFKNRNEYDRLMFIFSSRDFNQAFMRLKYLQQYTSFRKSQAELIRQTQADMEAKKAELTAIRDEKEMLLTHQEKEMGNLDMIKERKNRTIDDLSSKEKQLKKTIGEKEKIAEQLQKQIEIIIAEEMRRAAEAATETSSAAEGSFALTPEEKVISDSFAENRGILPWPTERGILSSSYGEHAHPVLKGIKTKNNGINILAGSGTIARSIFEGEVTRVISVPGYNNVVIIRHGEYLSVYSNLDEVMVSKGDKVITKQPVGVVHTDKDTSKTELHFELWKGKELLNPSLWIAR